MSGVVRTAVGYSGGTELDPTYRDIKDATESILIEYDPSVIEYEDLLVEWARLHSPIRQRKRQYRSAIFYVDENQRKAALDAIKAIETSSPGQHIYTDVERVGRFYRAEQYHQNYLQTRGMGGAY